jgi:hypothetical protein
MKIFFLLLFFLISIFQTTYCQGVYFKTSTNYNISTINRPIPEYFAFQLPDPYGFRINILNINEFSIASGLNFQGAVGYSLNDFLSFELRMSTFKNSKKVFKNSPESRFTKAKAEWDYENFSLLPTVLFGQTFNKLTINIFVYSGLGFSNLNIIASVNKDIFYEYEFDKSKTFSWGYGLEYAYSISKKFSVFTNIGVNNSNYKPKKAELISSSALLEYMTTSQKEIKYVDEITNLKLRYDGSSDPSSPEVRLNETLKLNSIYFSLGIKYTLKK